MSRRQPASSYGKRVSRGKKVWQPQPRVTQAERVQWARTRVRAATFRANMNKGDAALALAVVARKQELDRELRALESLERAHITQ